MLRFKALAACAILLSAAIAWADFEPVLSCEGVFSDTGELKPIPLKMKSEYIGEEKGEYTDPRTGMRWNVRYFNEQQRKAFEIFQRGSKFVSRKGRLLESEFDPESLHFQEGLLVVDTTGRKYFLPRDRRGRFHHSSIMAGGDVWFAGMVSFMNGQIRNLSDASGHYKADPERTKWFVRYLHRQGVDLSRMILTGRVARYYGNGSAALNAREIAEFLLD